ncbi:ammonium transporter [Oceanicella actignis]|uniref:Ammonium transporter n=1 Tax=Oceanicella actignis TaxID=1189325 RepID=A0A1M7RV69_9RHOB|nr:ammonium transporter [Oceanicella actignis]TYO89912.1 Amt family ammonium transporter [Oceanicella actignis]SET02098.1 ammonium transporter (TC 1.A.11) [Oceanicella actignis]SHN50189.1 ammonium transporter, Amt family [Oceanicella actignis]
MNGADAAWVAVASALVLFMTLPGLALFYGGLVRARNFLSVLAQCLAIACLMSLLWLAAGYSIAFGDEGGALWGGLGKAFMLGVGPDALRGTIPEILFFLFQMTFAIITPALIVGAWVERARFGFVLLFSSAWMLLCYAPVAHWIWGGGWLARMGTVDFAGGIVVHETAGLAALVLAAMLGPRRDGARPPHAPAMTMIGGAMLWVGWFGFNGGSQLAADGGAAMAMTVTHLSASAGALSWAAYERVRYGKASLIGLATGAIAGLATITPAAGEAGPLEAVLLGAVAGVLCQLCVVWVRTGLRIDDSLDVFAVHGVGGVFGTIMLAALGHADPAAQLTALAAVGAFVVAVTWALARLCALIVPMRVSAEDETEGLDYASHGERAYDIVS